MLDQAGVAAAVDNEHRAGRGVAVARSVLRTRSRLAAPRPHPDVVLVVSAPPHRAQGAVPTIWDHIAGNAGSVFAVVATFSTWMPGTARPSTAPAMASRWS